MSKKKNFLIYSIILLIILSIFVVLYLKTDLFKTKEQLFWKYFLKEKDEIVSIVSNDETKKYNKTIKKSSYIKEGDISVESKRNIIKPINVKITEKGNNVEKCRNIFVGLKYDNKDINETTIIEDNDYFYIKNDLINENYIGIENNNLKEAAKRIGIANTDFIPNKIKDIDYFELLSLSEEDTSYILKKCIPICRKYVKNKHYIKEENVKLENEKVTKYEVQVTEKQFNDLLIGVLSELKEDDKTLNIIGRKIQIIDEANKYCDINNIKNVIDGWIDYLEDRNVDEEIFLSIIIYKNKNDVVKTEFVLNNDRTISIQNDNNRIIIKQYDIKDNEPNLKSIKGIIKTALNTIYEITYEKQVENNEINRVNLNVKCNLGIEQLNINYNYVEQIKNNVEGIIRKDDIEYIDLNIITNNSFKNIVEKVLSLNTY